jgi:hypothetical protein
MSNEVQKYNNSGRLESVREKMAVQKKQGGFWHEITCV